MGSGKPEPWEAVVAAIKAKNTGYYGEGIALNHGIKNHLIDRLTIGENARLLWVTICRHVQTDSLESWIAKENPTLAYFCLPETFMQQLGRIDFKKPAEHKKGLLQIASLAKALKNSLQASEESNDPLLRLFGNPSYGYTYLGGQNLLLSIITGSKEYRDDIFLDARDLCFESCDAKRAEEYKIHEEILKGSSYEEMTPEQEKALEAYEPARDKDWLISALQGATIFNILDELEHRALKAANDALIVKRAKDRKSAEIKWLCNQLLPVHMHLFKTPLWDTLALAVSLCLDTKEPLTADDIRPLCK